MPPEPLDTGEISTLRLFAKFLAEQIQTVRGPDSLKPFSAQKRPGIRAVKIDLDAAQTDKAINLAGKGLVALDASAAGANCTIRFSTQNPGVDERLPFYKGIGYKLDFDNVFITNSAQSGVYLTAALLDSDIFEAFNFNIGDVDRISVLEAIDFITRAPDNFAGWNDSGCLGTSGAGDPNGAGGFSITNHYTAPAGTGNTAYIIALEIWISNQTPNGLFKVSVFTAAGAEDNNRRLFYLLDTKTNMGNFYCSKRCFPPVPMAASETLRYYKPAAADGISVTASIVEK